MKKVLFIFMLALGFAWNCHAQTWTYIQDSLATGCVAGQGYCVIGAGNMLPTVAGTVWAVAIHTQANVTITSVSGGGGTWLLCPASSCHKFEQALNGGIGENVDVAYNLTGNAGTTQVTVGFSGGSGTFAGANFFEFLPPPGATASFDAAGTNSSPTCTTACQGVGPLTLSATDLVLQLIVGNGPVGWHAWSGPWMTLPLGEGLYLNAPPGILSAPTVNTKRTGAAVAAIAFKSTAGSFTPPPQPISVVNNVSINVPNCNITCSLTIPSTGSGHLLYVEAGDRYNTYISSISGGGTWVVPSGANTCRNAIASTNFAVSCAYALSSLPGVTTLNVTMTGSANTSFVFWEIASTSGSFTFDTQGSAQRSPSFSPNGVALTLTGANDAIFQAIFDPGGTSAATFYPYGNLNFLNNDGGQVALLNVPSGVAPVPVWANEQNNATVVTGIAFRTGTALAPPTGLAAVVN